MARTRTYCCHYRRPPPIKRPKGAHSSLRPFEKEMLKYYPKQFRTFQNCLICQGNPPEDENGFKSPSVNPIQNYSPHRQILRKYNSGFLGFFSAYYGLNSPKPTEIPRNLKSLTLVEGPSILLKKLIKQNKGLKHISVNSSDLKVCQMIVKYLRFSKSLRSIAFKEVLPFFSEMMCRGMLRNWTNTMEKIEILGKPEDNYFDGEQSFRRVVESLLQFPKLKEFRLLGEASDHVEDFPLTKLLQERNIAYDVELNIQEDNYAALKEDLSECKLADCLVITDKDDDEGKPKKVKIKKWKIEQFSKRILRLNFLHDYFDESLSSPVLENLQSLQLALSENKYEYSSFGNLTSLKHLSIDIRKIQGTSYLKDFFGFLNENVAFHQKLETLLIKGRFETDIDKKNANAVAHFFEACSKTLRKAYLEFESSQSQDDSHLRGIYEALCKLEVLQSLTLLVYRPDSQSLEELTKIFSGMKSLEELDLKIKDAKFDEKKMNLTFPSQLKKLSFRVDASNAPFSVSKTLGPLCNLIHLELDFTDFSSWKLQKILAAPMLEKLVLKETNGYEYDKGEILTEKPRLEGLMKEGLNLKLVVFASIESRGMIILKRKNYPWSEINPVIDEIPFKKPVKFRYIQSY